MDMRKPIGVAVLAFAAIGLTGCPKPEAEPVSGGRWLRTAEGRPTADDRRSAEGPGEPVLAIDL